MKEDRNLAGKKRVTASLWVVMAHRMEDFQGIEKDGINWNILEDTQHFGIWTDNYSNIFETLF